MPLKNFYTLRPIDFKPGDVLACTVTLHFMYAYEDGTLVFRMYRCAYPDPQTSDGIPQGSRIEGHPADEIMEALFPVATSAIEIAKQK